MARVPQSIQMIPGSGQVTPICHRFPEVAGSTWVAGDFVYLNGGDLTIATAATAIMGVARENATGVTGYRSLVEIIRPGQEYAINLRLANDTFTESTDNGAPYDIVVTGAGNWELSKAGAGSARFRIIDTLEKTADGRVAATQGGPVRAVPVSASFQWGT